MSHKSQAQTWLSLATQYHHETQGFTLDLHSLSDDDLRAIKQVSAEFIDYAPHMERTIHPAAVPKFKEMIPYLQVLSALQSEAWDRFWEVFDEYGGNIDKKIAETNGR